MSGLFWLEKLKKSFASSGLDYEDLYELIEDSISRGRTNFPVFIHEASKGFGFTVEEGYFYSLDQDWEDPEEFNGVTFFLGEVETSSIPVREYVLLMKIATDVYSAFFPEQRDSVLRSFKTLEERYS